MNKEEEDAVIGDFSPVEVIEEHEKRYRTCVTNGTLTDGIVFAYSWSLIKSKYKNDIRKGIKLMGGLVQEGTDQRDFYYIMGLGHYKLEEYEEARNCVDRVLQMEPNNYQAKQLKELISKKFRRDGLIGLGVLGGAAVVGGALAVGAVALLGLGIAKAKK